MTTTIRLALGVILTVAVAADSEAQPSKKPTADLTRISLEDLMEVEITSAARREQRADDVPAAVFVITQDDIRRSGLRTLPELFRLVPGMQVAQVNSNKWGVSVRGFNDMFSDKLLVLIDGRSIYKRTFSGIFWHAEDLMLEDIDRIEVIRGAGGAIWGANAMNGVINIITKSAADTQGALVRVGAGTSDRDGAARYGGSVGALTYRVFGLWGDHGDGEFADGTAAHDTWHTAKTGLRADWSNGGHAVTVEMNYLDGRQNGLWLARRPIPDTDAFIARDRSVTRSGDVLGRWVRTWDSGAFLQAQAFYTNQFLGDPNQNEVETVADVDLEYHVTARRTHEIIFGGGYRDADHRDNGGSFSFSLGTPRTSLTLINLFFQDELALGPRLKLTLGSKLEYSNIVGWGLQPTARAMWELEPDRQHLWAAVSRATRTPSQLNLSERLNYAFFTGPQGVPIMLGSVGNPNFKTEDVINTEAGYRVVFGPRASLDVAVFDADYQNLLTNEPQPPVFETSPGVPHVFIATRFENLLQADAKGVEVVARLAPLPAWRLDGSYSGFHVGLLLDPSSRDTAAASFDGNAPAHQWQLHSSIAFGPRVEVNGGLYRVGRLGQLGIPGYTRADARVEFKLRPELSLVGSAQNFFSTPHAELSNPAVTQTLVRPNGHLQLTWRF